MARYSDQPPAWWTRDWISEVSGGPRAEAERRAETMEVAASEVVSLGLLVPWGGGWSAGFSEIS